MPIGSPRFAVPQITVNEKNLRQNDTERRSLTVCWSLLPGVGVWSGGKGGLSAAGGCLLPAGECLLLGGVCCREGVCCQGGVCSWGRGVYCQGGVCSLWGCLTQGVSAPGEECLLRGSSASDMPLPL